MNPQVLVFDEPLAQLDPRSRRQLIEMSNREFLVEHALESPLSYSRPYCLLKHSPVRPVLTKQ